MQKIYSFDEFWVDLTERQLWRAGEKVPLTPKVFELLLALLENRGRMLSKEELAQRLWPDTPVMDDVNLSRNVFLLRKALQDGEGSKRWIETVPKRGYRFIAENNEPTTPVLTEMEPPPPALPPTIAPPLSSRYFVAAVGLLFLLFGSATVYRWSRGAAAPPSNAEAEQLTLKGRHLWNKRTPENFQKGITLFKQAIDLDLAYAPAHAGLADCYLMLAEYQLSDAQEAFPRAKAAAQRALQLDERLAAAHITLGVVLHLYDWDCAAAEREFRRGLELDPNYAIAHQWYSDYLTSRQRYDEALVAIRRARTLDPLSPIIATTEGIVLYHAHRYHEAIVSLQKTLEWEPGFPPALSYLAMAYTEQGQYEAALHAYQQAAEKIGEEYILPGLAYVKARAGRPAAARQSIEQMLRLQSKLHFSPIYWALVYVGIGEEATALRWLEQAQTEHNPWLVSLTTDPRFDRLRSIPRFQQLIPPQTTP